MALADLTHPGAVLRAVEEFDRLGRDVFLRRYGFGRAREYFLVLDGRRYDPKAIAGAAHGHQFEDQGPLRAEDFSGGEATVKRRLEELGFTVERSAVGADGGGRNPPWSRDELILALELYLRHRGRLPGASNPEVIGLSALLNRMAARLAKSDAARFRNPNGVAMKLGNFSRFDPEYTAGGRVGLWRGAKAEEEVWRTFAADPGRLARTAAAIRAAVAAEHPAAAGGDDGDEEGLAEAEEGRILTRLHRTRERSRELVERRKALALRREGRLRCEACGFEAEARYGERGRGAIECHHVRPVHELRPGKATRLEDLRWCAPTATV